VPWTRGNEAGIVGRITQRLSELGNGRIDAGFKLEKRLIWPKTLLQLLAGDFLSRLLEEGCKNDKGLLLKRDDTPPPAELVELKVCLEDAEGRNPLRLSELVGQGAP
jgi:hypothetical protein